MNDLIVFTNEQFGRVRAVEINGESWLVGKDVVQILGYADVTHAVLDHVDEEDRINSKTQGLIDPEFGQRGAWLINESGFYSLVFSSKVPDAKRFKHWVTAEVLPSIRKTGSYSLTQKQDSYLIEDPIARAERWIEEQKEKQLLETKLVEKDKMIEKQAIQLDYKEDVIIGLVDNISLSDKRQILNRVVRYKHANYQERWSLLYREFENKYHLDLNRRIETYNETHKPKCKKKIDYIDKVMGKIPELYELAAKLFENDVKELVQEMYSTV